MGGGRVHNTKNSYKSNRKQSAAQKAAQVERCQATKRANKQKKSKSAKANFISNWNKTPQQPVDEGNASGAPEIYGDDVAGDGGDDRANEVIEINGTANDYVSPGAANSQHKSDDEYDVVIINPVVSSNTHSADVVANLDFDEEEAGKKKSDDSPDDLLPGIQQKYVEAIQKRLQSEVSEDNKSVNNWLLDHLKENGWWIRMVKAHWVAKKLGLKRGPIAFYRDVYVWLPDK